MSLKGTLHDEFIEKSKFPTYSDTDLDRFAEDLQKYYEVKTVTSRNGPEEIRVFNMREAAVGFGAMSKNENGEYAVKVKPIDFDNHGNPTKYEYPNMWQLFCDKYKQLQMLRGRRNFVEAKKIEGLEELAETMGVEHTSVEVDLETI